MHVKHVFLHIVLLLFFFCVGGFFSFFIISLQLDSLLCVCRFVYEWVFGCMCWDACMCV